MLEKIKQLIAINEATKELSFKSRISLAQALMEKLEKKGDNKHQHYKYVKAEDLISEVNKIVTKLNLRVYTEYIDTDYLNNNKIVNVKAKVIIEDCLSEAREEHLCKGSAFYSDKGENIALTQANKYGLKFAFNMSTCDEKEQDAENEFTEVPEPKEIEQIKTKKINQKLNNKLTELIKKYNLKSNQLIEISENYFNGKSWSKGEFTNETKQRFLNKIVELYNKPIQSNLIITKEKAINFYLATHEDTQYNNFVFKNLYNKQSINELKINEIDYAYAVLEEVSKLNYYKDVSENSKKFFQQFGETFKKEKNYKLQILGGKI